MTGEHRLHHQLALLPQHGHRNRRLVDIEINTFHIFMRRSFRQTLVTAYRINRSLRERGILL
jgi:hypothetical protein